jgi:Domain of unknown function (DUF1844)
MADKKNQEEFKVADRRRFSFEDGDVHENPERSPEPVREEATTAPPPEEPKKAEVREFPKRDQQPEAPKAAAQQDSAEAQQPPLTDAEKKAGDAAFAASSKQIDDQIRSQLGRKAEEFQMSFERFMASLYMTALMQLGLMHEQGGQPRVDLIGARQTIDTLALLRDKTKGNLTAVEENLMSNSLYEVQMAYVEVTNALTRSVQPAPPGAVPNPFVKK